MSDSHLCGTSVQTWSVHFSRIYSTVSKHVATRTHTYNNPDSVFSCSESIGVLFYFIIVDVDDDDWDLFRPYVAVDCSWAEVCEFHCHVCVAVFVEEDSVVLLH